MFSLIQQRDEIERLAHARLADHVDYQLLRKIPGIGPINALTILAEAGDLRRFSHHRQFLKFCGLDSATCQSGTFRGRTKLSKYGNARLRRTFWMAAQVAARQRDNSFRDKLGQYTAGHADDVDRRRKAMTALTAKMGACGPRRRQDGDRVPAVPRTTGHQVEGPLSASAVRARKRPCR